MEQYYFSEEAYFTEIRQWVLDWIRLYKEYAVSLDENGRLRQIKGSITFGSDLELSLEGQLTRLEAEAYEKEAERLRFRLQVFEEKAKNSLQRGIGMPVEYLFQIFHINEIERFCILMSLAVEYDRTIGRMFGLLHDNYREIYPTPDLLLKMYTADEEKRYRLHHSLMREKSGLVYLLKTPLDQMAAPIEVSPRILKFLGQYDCLDEELKKIAEVVHPKPQSRETRIGELAKQLNRAAFQGGGAHVCMVYGPWGAGKKTLVEAASHLAGRSVLHIDTRRIYQERKQLDSLLVKLIREMVIWGAVPCLNGFEVLQPEEYEDKELCQQKELLAGQVIGKITEASKQLFLTSERGWSGRWNWRNLSHTEWELPFPTMTEQIQVWNRLAEEFPEAELSGEALTVRFSLTPGQIMEAFREAREKSRARGGRFFRQELYDSCTRQLTLHLGNQVSKVKTQYQWEDLVLPGRQKEMLKRACNQIEYSHQVYELWGFNQKIAYGKGVSMVFYGPPGTGKTMGAQVMANQLSMELYKVDLSSVMSKYIGETEKNLGKVFDEVKKSRSILFFDEADALFGKRTEVKDSHDKYANAETAYLLQKIEEYQGIVILATNYMQNFDEAFKRRMKFLIEFPFPSPPYRQEMWKRVFPSQTPIEELDYEYLAEQFELSGSSIKNIAVAAAFLAAAEKEKVGMRQILLALREEMVKSGKSMPPESFGEYYSLLKNQY